MAVACCVRLSVRAIGAVPTDAVRDETSASARTFHVESAARRPRAERVPSLCGDDL